ncbi:MAG TPA: helix-turn-helix transcriptional regulator [Roseiflexaceae bacterium]|nr:helix-turn-helix transcriptional regulator [Roseiflexaceae bacterium]
MPTFGEKLRKLRKSHGLTQVQLAERLDYNSSSLIAMLESGERRPTLDLIIKLMPMFNVTADQLIRDDLDVDVS